VIVTVDEEDIALLAALSVMFCALPGVSVSVIGLAVTPAGSPLMVTVTIPVNPFAGTAFTLIACPKPPAVSATVIGANVIEKSAVGGGDCMFELQEIRAKHKSRQAAFISLCAPLLIADRSGAQPASLPATRIA
jgi:hypothetical protein